MNITTRYISPNLMVSFYLFLLLAVSTSPSAAESPVYLLEMGHKPNDYALVVDKKYQEIHLYKNSRNGLRLHKKIRCTTGKNNKGTKSREGDKKTPNGIYFFRSILEDDQLPEKYGVRAFTMDYPNPYDRLFNKTGYGIWLHAGDEDERVEVSYDTEGCVVVTNEDILELSEIIALNATPIIIDDSISTASDNVLRDEREKILDFVHNWADAWQNKDIDRYMDCYDERFYSYGRNKSQQRSYKERLNRAYKRIEVNLSDIRIYSYHDYYVVGFIQEYRSDRFYSKGPKKLYLNKAEDGVRIFAERMNR